MLTVFDECDGVLCCSQPEEYFVSVVKSPPVLGQRQLSKDGKVRYTSDELKKIDIKLDKARLDFRNLKSLWNVSVALGGYSLDHTRLIKAYKKALDQAQLQIVR